MAANDDKAPPVPVEPKTPVRLLRAYWLADEDRHDEGETIQVPVSLALELIEKQIAVRADPMPGQVA